MSVEMSLQWSAIKDLFLPVIVGTRPVTEHFYLNNS